MRTAGLFSQIFQSSSHLHSNSFLLLLTRFFFFSRLYSIYQSEVLAKPAEPVVFEEDLEDEDDATEMEEATHPE